MSASELPKVSLAVLPGRFAVCRLSANEPLPAWAVSGSWFSVTRTSEELSVVAEEHFIPHDVLAERGWRAIQVQGPLPFHLTGILAALAVPLANAGISLFAESTYDTDYVLLKQDRLREAIETLKAAGHTFLKED